MEKNFTTGDLVYCNGSNGIYGYGTIEYIKQKSQSEYLIHFKNNGCGWTLKDEYDDVPDDIKKKFVFNHDARFLWCTNEELEKIK